jgi:hypothetical protein
MDREALNDHPLGLYDVTVRIVTLEPDREIAWKIEGQLNLGHVYGYKLEPIDEGTLVTSCYDWSSVDQSWKDAAIFPVIPEGAPRHAWHPCAHRGTGPRSALGLNGRHFWSGNTIPHTCPALSPGRDTLVRVPAPVRGRTRHANRMLQSRCRGRSSKAQRST